MYQAAQNVLNGFGAICGASFGGIIADTVGWRWCFLLQVPVSIFALVVGHFVIHLPKTPTQRDSKAGLRGVWQQVDFSGALLLVLGLSAQLAGLSLGGNQLPWSNHWVVASLVGSVVLVALFLVVEAKTSAVPIIPLRMLRGVSPVCTQIANVCVGMAAYAVSDCSWSMGTILTVQFLFNLPLFFQVVLLDSASKAGQRLIIPSLATPVGGLIAGIVMSRWGKLAYIVRAGCFLMFLGNLLVMLLKFSDADWKYFVFIIPANLGQGMAYPGILFSFLAAFDHTGIRFPTSRRNGRMLTVRSRRVRLHRLSYSVHGHRLGRCHHVRNRAEYIKIRPCQGPDWNTRQMESKIHFTHVLSSC